MVYVVCQEKLGRAAVSYRGWQFLWDQVVYRQCADFMCVSANHKKEVL